MKYAVFDPSTGRVINWIDTSLRDYKLPAPEMLHECSEVEWERRELEQPQAVIDGAVVDFDTDIDLASEKRAARDMLITKASALLDRHRNQKEFGIATTLTDAEAAEVALYAQRLRDLPEQEGFPHVDLPESPK